ncbi:MAG TPA: hypothetical protein VLH19_00710 [Patescibacteria group bacterium]|nr:hypothetical protein [Patescibacteria group bacterium]
MSVPFSRSVKNPILSANSVNPWESSAAFNGSVLQDGDTTYLAYRAVSGEQEIKGKKLQVSSIGIAQSTDGVNFTDRRQLIKPELEWECYGCEDPRTTKIGNDYFVFYTALSDYPFYPAAIKIGVAKFSNLNSPPEKHLVTPFNSKAMALFPEKINGKYTALLTVNTDLPPAQVSLVQTERLEDLWSPLFWHEWYEHLSEHVLPLERVNSDQLEVGAVPVKTEKGWLVIYAHIRHYPTPEHRIFGIEAVLLDLEDPNKIIARTSEPLLVPQQEYEMKGQVASVVFPSGAMLRGSDLYLYYGAADTHVCLATIPIADLFPALQTKALVPPKGSHPEYPLLSPMPDHEWESQSVFNPAAFDDGETIHIVYRAMSSDNTSVFGHAKSRDGVSITSRSEMPVYVPRASFEIKKKTMGNSGCEDPRLTQIGERLYVCYTAYDGVQPPRVALASIALNDFNEGHFEWSDPVLISPPGIDDKDATIFPEKIHDKYVVIHRIQNAIVFDNVDDLQFDGQTKWLRSLAYISPRPDAWDSAKIGACSAPIKTEKGWLLFYHGVSRFSHEYRVGAMLLDLDDPSKVISRTPWPILEAIKPYERIGIVNNVVFPCGVVKRGDNLFIYYGGADKVVSVSTLSFSQLLSHLLEVATV